MSPIIVGDIVFAIKSLSRIMTRAKIGCRRTMSRPKNVSNRGLFNHDPDYVITPTYKTRDELDEKVQMLRQKSAQRGYSDKIPQRVFLQILDMRQPVGSREYKNEVLLNTGVRHMVRDKQNKPMYWYMQFKVQKSDSGFRDSTDPRDPKKDFNVYVG